MALVARPVLPSQALSSWGEARRGAAGCPLNQRSKSDLLLRGQSPPRLLFRDLLVTYIYKVNARVLCGKTRTNPRQQFGSYPGSNFLVSSDRITSRRACMLVANTCGVPGLPEEGARSENVSLFQGIRRNACTKVLELNGKL